jgi:methyl-accepting chemotaxis protein
MDQTTQQNASLVEEAAAAAEAMQHQAGHLSQIVSRFKLGAAGADMVRTAAGPSGKPATKPSHALTPLRVAPKRAPQPLSTRASRVAAADWEEF